MQQALVHAHALLSAGRLAEARQQCQSVLRSSPRHADWLHLAGLVEWRAGDTALAERLLLAALALQADRVDSLEVLAQLRLQAGRPADALEAAQAAERADSRRAQAPLLAANALWLLGRPTQALDSLDRALARDASLLPAHLYRALLLKEQGRHAEAQQALDRVLALDPQHVTALLNRGAVLQSQGQLQAARADYEQVLAIDPAQALPHAYLGLLDAHEGLADLARARYQRALQADPDCSVAHDLLARLDLAQGRFDSGWLHHERRFVDRPDGWARALAGRPEWDGRANGARLLLVAEQGVGDQILHCSQLDELRQRASVALLVAHGKLLPLLQRSFPGLALHDAAQPLPAVDFTHVLRTGSLGRWLRPDLAAFSNAPATWLRDDAQRTRQLLDALPQGPGPLVGLSWRSAMPEVGSAKSMSLVELLQALDGLGPLRLVNLQYGDVAGEIDAAQRATGLQVHQVAGVDPFNDLDALASLMRHCQAVVSTSNSTVHLAGALGVDTWVMVPHGLGRLWHWHERGGRCLWYPSVRVVPQAVQGQWSAPLADVRSALLAHCHD